MDSGDWKQAKECHLVAIPYPGRGHINPMMNLCKSLAFRSDRILISVIVTEEWLGFIGSETKPTNIRFVSIPNVLPSELVRAADMVAFIQAILTKMEAPVEQVLNKLDPPATIIIADTFLLWAIGIGNRRNIPVAALWPMPATVFSAFHHFDLLVQNGHFPVNLSEMGDVRVNYIPGISSARIADLPTAFFAMATQNLQYFLDIVSWVSKAQYLLVNTIYELETEGITALKAIFHFPVYSIRSATIPEFEYGNETTGSRNSLYYLNWLDSQPKSSVLYVSFGSFLSLPNDQMEEIAAGLRHSGVRFLWVARGEASRLRDIYGDNDMVLVVPWCDQSRVLSHRSIGGFWTHCGWNSVQEGVLAGVPFLTFPVGVDQVPSSKLIVEDWKVGWRVNKDVGPDNLVKREKISVLVRRFMDLESDEGKEMRNRARKLQKVCQQAIAEGGSCEANINAFMRDILQPCSH